MAAAARPYWTGFLKLSLVTIAVRLYSATTEKERIHFAFGGNEIDVRDELHKVGGALVLSAGLGEVVAGAIA